VTYPAVCSKWVTLLAQCGETLRRVRNRVSGSSVRWPAIRAWGMPLPNIGSMGGEHGPLKGATAEKAVPFPCAVRRSQPFVR
jgi:hypothetical protein